MSSNNPRQQQTDPCGSHQYQVFSQHEVHSYFVVNSQFPFWEIHSRSLVSNCVIYQEVSSIVCYSASALKLCDVQSHTKSFVPLLVLRSLQSRMNTQDLVDSKTYILLFCISLLDFFLLLFSFGYKRRPPQR